MKVTFIRHAETEYNAKWLFQGQKDINLSENGLQETINLSKKEKFDYDICFCSPLIRTKKTAEILFPVSKTIYDERIIERGFGAWEGTEITDEKNKMLFNNYIPENGEQIEHLRKRVDEFLNMIRNTYNDEKIIVVTHTGVIYMVYRILGLEIKKVHNLEKVVIDI